MIIKYLQLPFYFDVTQLKAAVSMLETSAWHLHYQTNHYEGDWKALPLRSIHGKADNIIISPTPNDQYEDTVYLKNSTYLKEVLAWFKCPLLAVRLLKLNAGAIIKEHKDTDLCFEKGEVRIHIPVITNEQVAFYLDKERIRMNEGECWYMNFNLPHSIINNSTADRIHLVIDAQVNEWLTGLFLEKAVIKSEIENPTYPDAVKVQIIDQLRRLDTETSNKLANELEATLRETS